jgi:SAM-dependent methyltransferase
MMHSSLQKSKMHWDDMGRLDPYWAILSEPGTKFGHWDLAEFLATGQCEIAALMAEATRFALPKLRSRALDFGCGVGRLTLALSEYFEEAVGIDISEPMICRAAQISNRPNCRFVQNDQPALPFPSDEFDLIYSAIVLQHVPKKSLIKIYISEFIRTLRRGGLLVMQVPSHIHLRNRLQPRRRLYAWLRDLGLSEEILYKKLRLSPIVMNFVPEREVGRVIESGGARLLSAVPDQRSGAHIASRTYYVTKD